MSTLYIMEAVNLFCGDDDPANGKRLSISELKLPVLSEKMADHHAGGSNFAIQVAVGMEALEATFKLAGWDPDMLVQFGLGSSNRERYTARGAIKDKRRGTTIAAKAIMEARLAKIEGDAFQRGELMQHDYMLAEILHYALYWDNAEKIYWNFFTGEWRVDGVSQNSEERRALGIS